MLHFDWYSNNLNSMQAANFNYRHLNANFNCHLQFSRNEN